MQAGGTWMAVSSNGRVAFLTNLREVGAPHERQQRAPPQQPTAEAAAAPEAAGLLCDSTP